MMQRNQIRALYFITPFVNVPSILHHGILCHRSATWLRPESIADPGVQQRRSKVTVPGGHALHSYANLYFCARNPMLFRSQSRHHEICVLSVRPEVLDRPGVVVTDQNAASDYARFGPVANDWPWIDAERVFAEYWTSTDQIDGWRRKAAKCAEVLVPERVPPELVFEARVRDEQARQDLAEVASHLAIRVDARLFFR